VILKSYDVRLGLNRGAKTCEGDKKTPLGKYHIVDKWNSKYIKFLAIDYPNGRDIKNAKKRGCKPGGEIGIHAYTEGLPKEGSDGCITVWTREEILEIDRLVRIGTEIEIKK
jgi:murein L,D-transpeptidase YafK